MSQSSTYQRAQTAAAEELLAKKIELMDEKYALEDRVEGLLMEIDLKGETVRQLQHDISTKDQRIKILEGDPLDGGRLLLNELRISQFQDEITQAGQDIDLNKGLHRKPRAT